MRILNEGSLAAIHAALAEDPEGFHVLHLSCHTRPGALILEAPDGEADAVSAERLLAEGIPTGADLSMIVLSEVSAAGNVQPSLAAELVRAGMPQVLAMQAPVTGNYETRLAAVMYRHLATDASPDPLLALAEARRSAEWDRLGLPTDPPRRGPAEWAAPVLVARELRLPLFNRDEPFGKVRQPQTPTEAGELVVPEAGEFIGRNREVRRARRILARPGAGLVIHGLGGVGTSSLAAQVLRTLGEGAGLVVSKTGPLLVDDLLGEIGARINQAASGSGDDRQVGDLAQAGLALRAADIEWTDRWRLLAELVLPVLPMTVLLDSFDYNLRPADDGVGWTVGDPELADLLARWVSRPGQSHLIITSRYPFSLADDSERLLDFIGVGPMSPAEARKLMWRLPGLDALSPQEKDRAYRDTGGHPRTLEYLDALLRGRAVFGDVAARVENFLRARDIPDPAAWLATADRDLDTSLAETITLAASDVLLPTLLEQLSTTPLALELVIGASVYRVPVDDTGLVFQVGKPVRRAQNPARQHRLGRVSEAIAQAQARNPGGQLSLEDAGLSADEYAQFEADLAEEGRPPYDRPAGLVSAIRAGEAAGLLTSVPGSGGTSSRFVHRWTAAAIAAVHAGAVAEAHVRAAAFWRWRVSYVPQSRDQDVEQLQEARYHHHAAGQISEALEVTDEIVAQLETWGQYGRAADLCRDTLTWLSPDALETARFVHRLGRLAQARGDYKAAQTLYRQALDINERLGNEPGIASSYGQLGMLARDLGDYATAENRYRQALEINERLGNQSGMASSYGQLGMLAQLGGNYATAENRYRQALEINERLGNQAGIAGLYHQLGILAQDRGDYTTAENRYHQSLELDERLGDQAGMASSYGQLGNLAYLRGDYATAENRYRQALEINERLGNQAGIAGLYHQLGMLAQDRGDYTTAENRYRQALEINERLGDQTDMAASYHQLGMLAQDRGDYTTAENRYRQALEINERLGDQADMAASYHQLGKLAQDRGDYTTAENRYRQALEINERLGNQAEMASGYSALASLSEAPDAPAKAIALLVAALTIRLRIGTPASGDVRVLSELRRRLGADRFRAALPTELDKESAENLINILDQWENTATD